ncbi:MAG TPA: fibronectin type III domain-containing protein [Phycisphaerales bacterium]|nr:fibronectin type III domain-containing protein [Phycisphaerales bacterium]
MRKFDGKTPSQLWVWDPYFHVPIIAALLLTAFSGYFLGRAIRLLPEPRGTNEEISRENYKRCLVGLGSGLLAATIITVTALAGFAYSGVLGRIFGFARNLSSLPPTTGPAGVDTMVLLFSSLLMALLGALFYVTNSLHEKRRKGMEDFDWSIFWSGLWYRLGEAVLFTIVFFVAIRRFAPEGSDEWLPILALFLGMSVTAGERLVFGLARRVFLAVGALLPLEGADVNNAFDALMPDSPTNLKAGREADGTILVRWERPTTGPTVRGFKIELRPSDSGVWRSVDKREAGENSAVLIGIRADIDHSVRVVAFNDAGESDPTPAVAVKATPTV